MEGLIRFDVASYRGHMMVVVESELLPQDPAIVVIPLIAGYPAVKYLNPEIRHDGVTLILATRLIASVPRAALTKVGTVADQGDVITRAIDVLLAGV